MGTATIVYDPFSSGYFSENLVWVAEQYNVICKCKQLRIKRLSQFQLPIVPTILPVETA